MHLWNFESKDGIVSVLFSCEGGHLTLPTYSIQAGFSPLPLFVPSTPPVFSGW